MATACLRIGTNSGHSLGVLPGATGTLPRIRLYTLPGPRATSLFPQIRISWIESHCYAAGTAIFSDLYISLPLGPHSRRRFIRGNVHLWAHSCTDGDEV